MRIETILAPPALYPGILDEENRNLGFRPGITPNIHLFSLGILHSPVWHRLCFFRKDGVPVLKLELSETSFNPYLTNQTNLWFLTRMARLIGQGDAASIIHADKNNNPITGSAVCRLLNAYVHEFFPVLSHKKGNSTMTKCFLFVMIWCLGIPLPSLRSHRDGRNRRPCPRPAGRLCPGPK